MSELDVQAELEKLKTYAGFDKLRTHLEHVREVCTEPVRFVIPSIVLGQSGPRLKALFVLTDSYLSEVDVSLEPREHFNFDVVPLKSILSLRFKWDDVEVKVSEEETITYSTAKIEIWHVGSIQTDIEYVGADRDGWLATIRKAFPLSLLLQTATAWERDDGGPD